MIPSQIKYLQYRYDYDSQTSSVFAHNDCYLYRVSQAVAVPQFLPWLPLDISLSHEQFLWRPFPSFLCPSTPRPAQKFLRPFCHESYLGDLSDVPAQTRSLSRGSIHVGVREFNDALHLHDFAESERKPKAI